VTPTSVTIGVAIAVPDPWGEWLQVYRRGLGDSSADGIPTHVTLMPPTAIAVDALPAVEKNLSEASAVHSAFRIHLRGTGTFRPVSPVVFVTVVEGISACEQLAASVRREPLTTRPRFPYHPHVTVAHDLPDEILDRAFDELATFECEFPVGHFSLFAHDAEAGWMPTRDFPLSAGTHGVPRRSAEGRTDGPAPAARGQVSPRRMGT
jgi:2'-5' RNA ligase